MNIFSGRGAPVFYPENGNRISRTKAQRHKGTKAQRAGRCERKVGARLFTHWVNDWPAPESLEASGLCAFVPLCENFHRRFQVFQRCPKLPPQTGASLAQGGDGLKNKGADLLSEKRNCGPRKSRKARCGAALGLLRPAPLRRAGRDPPRRRLLPRRRSRLRPWRAPHQKLPLPKISKIALGPAGRTALLRSNPMSAALSLRPQIRRKSPVLAVRETPHSSFFLGLSAFLRPRTPRPRSPFSPSPVRQRGSKLLAPPASRPGPRRAS